jgi:hypothetical protein
MGRANPNPVVVRPFSGRFLQNFRHNFLAQNTSFAHVGAPRGCQGVVISVHKAKTRHSGRVFGRKTARKRPYIDQIRISATQTRNYA